MKVLSIHRRVLWAFAFVCVLAQEGKMDDALHPKRSADGKWGYVDSQGRFVIPPVYEIEPRPFSEGMAGVGRFDPSSRPIQYAFINRDGALVIPYQFREVGPFQEGLAAVGQGRSTLKWGFIDRRGYIVVPLKWSCVFGFSYGVAVVEDGKRYGLVDRQGRIVVKPRFECPFTFVEGVAAVRENGKYGYLLPNGSFLAKPQYDTAEPFTQGRGAITLQGRSGWVEKDGREALQPPYEFDWKFVGVQLTDVQRREREREGLYPKEDLSGKWGYMNVVGQFVIPPIFSFEPESFLEGLAIAAVGSVKGPHYGFIDAGGRFVIPPTYEFKPESFSEGLAVIMLPNPENLFKKWRYGYIDKQGNAVIPAKYDSAWSFEKGIAVISEGGAYRQNAIDKVKDKAKIGMLVMVGLFGHGGSNSGWTIGGSPSHGKDKVSKWGMIDKQGRYIVRPEFDRITPFSNAGIADVEKDGRRGSLTREGRITWAGTGSVPPP